jgi:hypothetical protein
VIKNGVTMHPLVIKFQTPNPAPRASRIKGEESMDNMPSPTEEESRLLKAFTDKHPHLLTNAISFLNFYSIAMQIIEPHVPKQVVEVNAEFIVHALRDLLDRHGISQEVVAAGAFEYAQTATTINLLRDLDAADAPQSPLSKWTF